MTGHECVNELIVSRLLSILGIDHLSYRLIHAETVVDGREIETWMCASDDFRRSGESKLALDVFWQLERKQGECPLDFCVRMGWEQCIYEMLLTDFLILNRDARGESGSASGAEDSSRATCASV